MKKTKIKCDACYAIGVYYDEVNSFKNYSVEEAPCPKTCSHCNGKGYKVVYSKEHE